MNRELIPKQITQMLKRGGAEVVKVEREECFGKQPLLRGQWGSGMAVYLKPADQPPLFPYHC